MSDHAPTSIERHCDVAVIGGSAAGLAAALELGRRGRSVIVIDSGETHLAPAAHLHGDLGRAEPPPSELTAAGREAVRRHGGEVLSGQVSAVTRIAGARLRVEVVGGYSIVARRVLDASGRMDVPGVSGTGDMTDPSLQAKPTDDDLGAADEPAANQADWDHRYGGGQLWSGHPNGTLVNEVSGMRPGRALDVGAGEGGDALWLAEQGWHVTASDISGRALERIEAEASRRGLHVECHRSDANALGAFETNGFDLVSAQYASIPRTPDDRGVRNLINAVAPGGTLLIVNHDLEAMRAAADTAGHSQPFDPGAYVQTADFAAALRQQSTWDIEVNEKRPRPAGAVSASHHVEDVVLRARRSAN